MDDGGGNCGPCTPSHRARLFGTANRWVAVVVAGLGRPRSLFREHEHLRRTDTQKKRPAPSVWKRAIDFGKSGTTDTRS